MTNIPVAVIQDVTNFLRLLLRREIRDKAKVEAADVTLLPPGQDLSNTKGANLYLYRVVESPATKNQDWRGNRTRPPLQRPVLGLQLSYLVTPLAGTPDDQGDDAHAFLGAVMLTLHENAILNHVHLPCISAEIPRVDADIDLPESIHDSYEEVKVTLLPTSVDEISRIWATLNQPYRLSVAYEVSLVELFPSPTSQRRGDIVQEINVDVTTMSPPKVRELLPASGPLFSRLGAANSLSRTILQINGFGLIYELKKHIPPPLDAPTHRQLPVVRVGGQIVEIDDEDPSLSEQALRVTMPPDIDAGPQADVRVTLKSRISAPVPFMVTPWLTRTTPLRTSLENVGDKITLEGFGFNTPRLVLFLQGGVIVGEVAFDPVPIDTPEQLKARDKKVTATIPSDLKNGLYDVCLEKGDSTGVGDPNSVTNTRRLVVLPLLKDVEQATVGDVTELTLNGARLDGAEIRVVLDGVTYQTVKNTNPAQLAYKLARKLVAGEYSLSVSVDGHVSKTIPFRLPQS